MPLRRLSKQYGTVMFRLNFRLAEAQSASRPALASSNSNSQAPFRLRQCSRWNCGWGYSGRGMAAECRPQHVRRKRAAGLCMCKVYCSCGAGLQDCEGPPGPALWHVNPLKQAEARATNGRHAVEQASWVEWFGTRWRLFMTSVKHKTRPIRVGVVSIALSIAFGSLIIPWSAFQRKTRTHPAKCIPPGGWRTANNNERRMAANGKALRWGP